MTVISILTADDLERRLDAFAALMLACVEDGASVGFVLPFTLAESAAFWTNRVLPGVRSGKVLLLAAERAGKLAGTVQLDCDTMPNQPHRAEVRKLLVHPDFRRQGVARALMAELERQAALRHRRLLTLDTRTGDSAEPLYGSIGYRVAGIIPDFCRDTIQDRLDPTTIMYKAL
ncbi:GNAT family N-acetyltransferase [Oceanibaculum pacificum]|uniref:Acetyltransferase n=1 Tax=Oceanibaculum pacificum TaxID=580166 RepID=A0A154WEY2_9PROT|nr:GNAT family N-acetyltransferase [Oceanibaculum pacificum]KZD12072.1 acetyltransferase [Oceanibaculum pacificum]